MAHIQKNGDFFLPPSSPPCHVTHVPPSIPLMCVIEAFKQACKELSSTVGPTMPQKLAGL